LSKLQVIFYLKTLAITVRNVMDRNKAIAKNAFRDLILDLVGNAVFARKI